MGIVPDLYVRRLVPPGNKIDSRAIEDPRDRDVVGLLIRINEENDVAAGTRDF
jgi:hypothetical protein